MSKPNTKALVTLTNLKPVALDEGQIGKPVAILDTLIDRALKQHAIIKQGERDGAMRAIFLGILFWQIKNEAGHGNFMNLASERMSDIPQRTRQDYMKLALTFVERTRLALPSTFNIPDAQLSLGVDGPVGTEREMLTKAAAFIGELSLHELMIKYGIRAVGLKTELAAGEEEKPAANEAEAFFGDLSEKLYGLRTFATDPAAIMRLTPEQLATVDQTITDTYTQWKRQYAEAKGGKKEV